MLNGERLSRLESIVDVLLGMTLEPMFQEDLVRFYKEGKCTFKRILMDKRLITADNELTPKGEAICKYLVGESGE